MKKKTMPTFGTFSEHEFAAQLLCKLDGFLQRALGLLTQKFPNCCAASLMDLLLHLCLPELRL